MPIEVIAVPPSGNIVNVSYDADAQTLYVQFVYQNSIYKYSGIDGDTANGFSRALSASQYLRQSIIPISIGERVE